MSAPESLEMILPHADMVLYDLKEIDPEKHTRFTESSNEVILSNILKVRDAVKSGAVVKEMWVRTPIIPGATDTEENIRGIGGFIAANMDGAVSRWELCSFNNLCRDKYTRLGMDWQFNNCEVLERKLMDRLAEVARKSGVKPGIVHWSGSVKLEDGETVKVAPATEPRVSGCGVC
jgi:pyruvate formate lyase activating enzyme